MSQVGQLERTTQNRVVALFQKQLGYGYYGDWQERADNSNIEKSYLRDWLIRQGVDETMANKAIRKFKRAAAVGDGK
ncbi:MAG: hypothetical protein RPU91_16325, partial [Candidatus Sedimenticola sp. (ex Thyasira tokunagai)]